MVLLQGNLHAGDVMNFAQSCKLLYSIPLKRIKFEPNEFDLENRNFSAQLKNWEAKSYYLIYKGQQ